MLSSKSIPSHKFSFDISTLPPKGWFASIIFFKFSNPVLTSKEGGVLKHNLAFNCFNDPLTFSTFECSTPKIEYEGRSTPFIYSVR